MQLAEEVGKRLQEKKKCLSTAESCTGGGIAAMITAIPGSSEYFKGGIVAYANEIKTTLLHVAQQTLIEHGAVSEETVLEMVKGAMKTMKTDCAIATSGIAGPGGGTPQKPVGTIWLAVANGEEVRTMKLEGDYGRAKNVKRTIEKALILLLEMLK